MGDPWMDGDCKRTHVLEYPERNIRIVIKNYRQNDENHPAVRKIVEDNIPGTFTVELNGASPSFYHDTYSGHFHEGAFPATPSGDDQPTGENRGMFMDPSGFVRHDPNHPLRRLDPDRDDLPKPGGEGKDHFI